MRRYLVAAVFAAALALPVVAAAKGPESASIVGADLGRALAVRGDGELGNGTPLGTLVDLGGFFPQMYGQSPDPTTASRPKGTLGPGYRVAYVVPGPGRIESRVVQRVYPYATPVPVTYMKPRQRFWGTQLTHGGWYRSTPELRAMLVRLGLSPTPPATRAGFWSAGTIGAAVGLAAAALLGLARPWRRRPRRA